MEISANFTDKANAVIKTVIEKSSLDNKVNELARKAAKSAKIDGFRSGKVPVSVVLKRYEKELDAEAKQDILKDIIDEALKTLNKKSDDIMGEPSITKFDEKDGSIDTNIEISFKPEVKIEEFESVVPEYSTPRVSKKEIEAKINELLQTVAPLETSDKDLLEKDDFAKFDFEGSIDGKVFEGGSAKDYTLQIGSNQFIPGFEDGMIGMKIGQTKDIEVEFPQDYQAKDLAGKKAVFKVTLNEIKTKVVPETPSEEMLKSLMPEEKEPNIEKLEEKVKEQIRSEKFIKLLNEELKPKFADAIIEKYPFDLPKNIVEQEIDMQFRNAWSAFSPAEMKEFRENKDALTQKRESYRDDARRSVALTFVVDALAKIKKIEVSDEELVRAIYFEAYRYGTDPKKHLESYRSQGLLPAVKMAMVEEKLFDDIFKKDKKESKDSKAKGE